MIIFGHLTRSEYGYICAFPPSGTTGPSATYFSLALYFLNQELIGRICWRYFRCAANTSEMAWLYCLKTTGSWQVLQRNHAHGRTVSEARETRCYWQAKISVLNQCQHSQDPSRQLQCCVLLGPDLLPRLLCLHQPASFPPHGPDTGKGAGKERAEEGRRANKYLYYCFPWFYI